jgi:hypothetical protein
MTSSLDSRVGFDGVMLANRGFDVKKRGGRRVMRTIRGARMRAKAQSTL